MKDRKILSLIISLILVLNSFLVPVSDAYAEEQSAETETHSPLPEDSSSSTNESNGTNESNSNSGSEMTTGDSTAVSQTDSTINYTETTTEGDVTTDGCSVDGSISCPVEATNVAETDNSASSDSTSGQNSATDLPGDSTIGTGDSTASSTSNSLINTNIIEATEEAKLESESDQGLSLDKDGPYKETEEASVDIVNTADHNQENTAESTSGQNESSGNAGDATINTGASIAEANQVNIINTNIIGTEFETLLLSLYGNENGDIDLNQIWKDLENFANANPSASITEDGGLLISIENSANVDVSAQASAISGQNKVLDNGGDASIATGDSYASANIFNLVNMNVLGSRFLLAIINIFGNFSGNIIVPNPDVFKEGSVPFDPNSSSNITSQNQAYLTSGVSSSADSGSNSQINEQTQIMETGDSYAQATSTNLANLNLYLTNWYLMFLNNFGLWTGQVESWENPQAKTTSSDVNATYQVTDNPAGAEALASTEANSENQGWVDLENRVSLNADVSASAISGQNETENNKNSTIKTGRSVAFANLFNLLNTNIIGTRFFMPIINLFGSWTGNLIFAYPILNVGLTANKENVSPGDQVNYTVTYENVGYEDARNTILTINVPSEITIGNVNVPDYLVAGNTLKVTVGTVPSKKGGSFSFSGTVSNPTARAVILGSDETNRRGTTPESKLGSGLTRSRFVRSFARMTNAIKNLLIKPVSAAEIGKALTTTANINTTDSQADTSKNSSSFTVYLIESNESDEPHESNSSDEENALPPVLTASSSNNTGEYVYPGDQVTFFVNVENKGEGEARDVVVDQFLYNGSPITKNQFKVGTIYPHKSKKLTFSLQIPPSAGPGVYSSLFVASVTAGPYNGTESNETVSDFMVKLKFLNFIPEVQAKEETGQVLGKTAPSPCKEEKDLLPYILLIILASLWFVESIRRKRLEKKLDEILYRLKSK